MGSSDKLLVSRREHARDGRGRGSDSGGTGAGEVPSFKPISRKPSQSDGAMVWRKYYLIVEGQLRSWYKLKNSLDAPEQTMEKWNLISPYVISLMTASATIFRVDTSYYIKNELDIRLWKYGIYQFIVLLRNLPSESKYKSSSKLAYHEVFEKGVNYFKELLINVPEVLNIDLKAVFSRSAFLHKSTSQEIGSENLVYRLFIALGDMYRYAFEMNKLPRNGKLAKDMYVAARFCDPEKSRAYNQLGVISKAQNDIVGTIYNYTRAWSAPSPADGSREQLLFVFDEIYKKFQVTRKEYWYYMCKNAEENLTRSRQSKYEIWVPPKSILKLALPPVPEIPPKRDQYFSSLPHQDVINKFSLAYAYFVGMLFTKIGTEALEDVAKEVIVSFEGLMMTLKYVKFGFLMEVFGLLLFMTDYLTPPTDASDPGAVVQIQYMRDEAVRVTENMIVVVSERMQQIMKLLDWDNSMLTACSATLHVWCRWARRRPFICADLVQKRKLLKRSPRRGGSNEDMSKFKFMDSMIQLSSMLSTLFTRHANILFPKVYCGSNKGCSQALGNLPEYLVLSKFGNILLPQDFDTSSYHHDGISAQEKAQLHFRLARIQRFLGKVFSDQVVDSTLTPDDIPVSIADTIISNEFHLIKFIYESIDKPIRALEVETGKVLTRPDCNNARMIVRKHKVTNEEMYKRSEEVPLIPMTKIYELWSDLCVRGVRTEVVIEPLDVVLDTNCLIRQLDWITCLIRILPRPLVIPSTVLLELRGLRKGARSGESAKPGPKDLSPDKQQEMMIDIMELGEKCIRALQYLNENKHYFRVVTICGNDFKMYNYIKQKIFEKRLNLKARNDEKILETCSQMELRNKSLRGQDSPLRIYRKTVLLTGDCSLRLRAFKEDIPARDIQSFTKWLLSIKTASNTSLPVREGRGRRKL